MRERKGKQWNTAHTHAERGKKNMGCTLGTGFFSDRILKVAVICKVITKVKKNYCPVLKYFVVFV